MSEEQPKPQKNDHPECWPTVIERSWRRGLRPSLIQDMEARHKLGVERYGVGLQPHNGRDAIRDLYEELLDARVYAEQAFMEGRNPEQIRAVIDRVETCLTLIHGIRAEKA